MAKKKSVTPKLPDPVVLRVEEAQKYAQEYIDLQGYSWFEQFDGPEDEGLMEFVREWLGFKVDSDYSRVPDEVVTRTVRCIIEEIETGNDESDIVDLSDSDEFFEDRW